MVCAHGEAQDMGNDVNDVDWRLDERVTGWQ